MSSGQKACAHVGLLPYVVVNNARPGTECGTLVAGHALHVAHGTLSNGTAVFLKLLPDDGRGLAEARFYAEAKEDLKRCIPKCHGVTICSHLNGQPDCYLVLEDVGAHFRSVCAMDLKLGVVTYSAHSTLEKRCSQQKKALRSTTHAVGYRVTGGVVQIKQPILNWHEPRRDRVMQPSSASSTLLHHHSSPPASFTHVHGDFPPPRTPHSSSLTQAGALDALPQTPRGHRVRWQFGRIESRNFCIRSVLASLLAIIGGACGIALPQPRCCSLRASRASSSSIPSKQKGDKEGNASNLWPDTSPGAHPIDLHSVVAAEDTTSDSHGDIPALRGSLLATLAHCVRCLPTVDLNGINAGSEKIPLGVKDTFLEQEPYSLFQAVRSVAHIYQDFLRLPAVESLLRELLRKCAPLLRWAATNNCWIMRGSSLVIFTEGDRSHKTSERLRVMFVDFANCTRRKVTHAGACQSSCTIDHAFLHGIGCFVFSLQVILGTTPGWAPRRCPACCPASPDPL